MPHEPKVGELPALPNELDFEQWYVENAFDYAANPIGSRDCSLQRKAWHAALAAEREARKDEARDSERLDWLEKHAQRIGRDGGWLGHYEVIVAAWDGTPYSEDRGLALHTDTLRAAIDAALAADPKESP